MEIINTLLIFSVLKSVAASDILLSAPHYTQKGLPIRLTCSSTALPVGRTAEFLTDGGTVANIRSHNGYCFNTLNSKECTAQSCRCHKGGKTFVLFYMARASSTGMTFRCKMKYNDNRIHVSNRVSVTIMDMMSPKIYISKEPFISGMAESIQCNAVKTSEDVMFSWECGFGLYPKQIENNDTFIWSTMVLKVDSSYNGKSCTCRLQSLTVNFSLSDTVILKVQKVPILSLNEGYHCNKSDSVGLICSVMGDLGMFGFDPWIHRVNGVHIRSLKGVVTNYVSLLLINQCSFEDFGDYTCSVWNEDLNETLWANKTTHLAFTGPPIIKNKTTSHIKDHIIFNCRFYSNSRPYSVQLQCNDNTPPDVNHSYSLLERVPVLVNMYGKMIELTGYKASFSIQKHDCDTGKYTICVENEYSKECQYLQLTSDGKDDINHHYHVNVSWFFFGGISAIIVIPILVIVVVYLVRLRKLGSNEIQINQEVIAPLENYSQYIPPQNVNRDEQTSNVQQENEESITVPRRYNDLQGYQSSRVYSEPIPEYLEVLPDIDTISKSSDGYEKVE